MKIAIPTDDGFTIDEFYKSAKGFLVTTIESGHIKKQELRTNLITNDSLNSIADTNLSLADCDTLILRNIDPAPLNSFDLVHKEVVRIEGILIAEELMKYIQMVVQKESDTCCCP